MMKRILLSFSLMLLVGQGGYAEDGLKEWENQLCSILLETGVWSPVAEKHCEGSSLSALMKNAIDYNFPNHVEIFRIAIKLGMPPSLDSNRLLFYSIINLDLPILRLLVASGADLEKEFHGRTPLHLTAEYPFVEGTRLLISAGAIIDSPSSLSMTALHHAVRKSDLDVARVLVQAGANVNALTDWKDTPLHYVLRYKSWEPRNDALIRINLCKLLIGAGADRDIENDEGETAYEIAKKHSHPGLRNCTEDN